MEKPQPEGEANLCGSVCWGQQVWLQWGGPCSPGLRLPDLHCFSLALLPGGELHGGCREQGQVG